MSFDTQPIRKIAEDWLISNERPRVDEGVLQAWDRLIEEWAEAQDLPLLLRATGRSRGQPFAHLTGRELVCADNSLANWALSSALKGSVPSLREVHDGLASGRIPIAFALKLRERATARYPGSQRAKMDPPNLNTLGWKVCHVLDIGIKSRGSVADLPVERLLAHFRLFLNPRNMFVVPKQHGGVGEMPDFQAVFRNDPWFGKFL